LPSQTWPEPQGAPALFGAPSTQAWAPLAHEVIPVRQALPPLVVQAVPAVQLTHWPDAVQTWSAPQVVPAGLSASSRHTGAPLLQSVTPRRQALPGFEVQPAPCVQATHAPLPLQT
jgi:hypothetical protein